MSNDTSLSSDGLTPLSEAGEWKVSDGDPDVRGWDVLASTRETVGVVKDLLVDTAAQKARYLVVTLTYKQAPGRRVLIPVGVTELDDASDVVLVPSMEPPQVLALPTYERGTFDRAHESAVRQCIDGTCDTGVHDFYDHPHFDQHRMHTRRLRRRREDRQPA